MNNNNLKLPNKFQLMDIDEVIYEFENKYGTLVGAPSISKDTDWTWKDLERWAALRTIPNGYPSTLKRLAYLDMTEWSWEAQLVIRRGMSPLDNYWLRFHDTETFDNLPHTRSKNHPPMPDTPGIVIFKK